MQEMRTGVILPDPLSPRSRDGSLRILSDLDVAGSNDATMTMDSRNR